MQSIALNIPEYEAEEIKAAAEIYGVSIPDYMTSAVFWVLYNCAEVPGRKPLGVDRYKNL